VHPVAASSIVSPVCFIDPVWSASEIDITKDVQYGEAFNNATQKLQTLLLDAYMPPSSDNRSARPIVVIIHGGSFDAGHKDDPGEVELALALATRGFAVVSIDYRLTGDFWTWESERMMLDATEDARAAIRYVRSVATDQRIDTERILLVGESAGAWTSLFLGYVKAAQYEGNSGNPGYASTVAGVWSISGELRGQGFCKGVLPVPWGCKIQTNIDNTNDITNVKQPPLLIMHGTADTIVPYVNGKEMYTRAQAVGLQSSLITMQGADHVPWSVIFNQSTYFHDALTMCGDVIDLAHAQMPAGCIGPGLVGKHRGEQSFS